MSSSTRPEIPRLNLPKISSSAPKNTGTRSIFISGQSTPLIPLPIKKSSSTDTLPILSSQASNTTNSANTVIKRSNSVHLPTLAISRNPRAFLETSNNENMSSTLAIATPLSTNEIPTKKLLERNSEPYPEKSTPDEHSSIITPIKALTTRRSAPSAVTHTPRCLSSRKHITRPTNNNIRALENDSDSDSPQAEKELVTTRSRPLPLHAMIAKREKILDFTPDAANPDLDIKNFLPERSESYKQLLNKKLQKTTTAPQKPESTLRQKESPSFGKK